MALPVKYEKQATLQAKKTLRAGIRFFAPLTLSLFGIPIQQYYD